MASSSGEESPNLLEQGTQCETLERLDCVGNVPTAPRGLWLGAIYSSLHRVQKPDNIELAALRQRRQNESMGQDVLPASAEESGSIL